MKQFLPLSIIGLLILAVGCHSFQPNKDNFSQSIMVSDSLWMPTGDEQLDSLLQVAAGAPQDTSLAKLYSIIGGIYEDKDFEMAKEYFLKLKHLSEQLNWSEGRYLYAVSFANLLNREGLRDSAMNILQQAYNLALRENDEVWTVNIIFSEGNIYFANEWYETALTYYMEALLIYEKMNDSEKIHQLYYMMSQLYQCINAIDKAIEYGKKSVLLNPESEGALCALAMAYSKAHQYDKAQEYFEKALTICELEDNVYLMGVIYFHLANNAMAVFDLVNAEKYVHQSLGISQQFGPACCCIDIILLSKIEQLKGNYVKSDMYVKEALPTAIEFEALEEQKLCYSILAELAIVKGNARENIQYWEELDLIEMEIGHLTTLRAAEEMNAKYETAQNELEIERQKRVIARQNMQHLLLLMGIALCVIIFSMLLHIIRLRNIRNRELLEMNITKDKFFNIISHDLKNPAVAQRNALKVLVKNARAWDDNTLADYHLELLKSAEGQIELLLNLLNWSRLQTGRIEYCPETFVISELHPSLILIRSMAEKKGIFLDIQIPEKTIMTCDSKMLTTIIRNLLTNAIKFTQVGGTVTLNISPCTDIAKNSNTKYNISVADTGVGISETNLRKLFRLGSAHTTGTVGEQGSGLGLIICKELLEKHGSKLHVESEESKGSRFWFIV